MDTEEVLRWMPASEAPPRSFLAGLPGAVLREDAMIVADFSQIPGFEAVKDTQFAAKEFVDPRDSNSRLMVLMANRLPLEQQTGADLIYYHERHKAFVMVQYKAMDGKKSRRLSAGRMEISSPRRSPPWTSCLLSCRPVPLIQPG